MSYEGKYYKYTNSDAIHPFQNPPLCSSTDMPAVIDKGEDGANEDDSSLGLF
jgi:hypothetical protein